MSAPALAHGRGSTAGSRARLGRDEDELPVAWAGSTWRLPTPEEEVLKCQVEMG